MSTPDTPTSVPSELPRSGTATTVHNHGSEDGPGLACREHRVDGRLVGECMAPAAVSREDGGDEPPLSARLYEMAATPLLPLSLVTHLRALAGHAEDYEDALTASRSRVAALEADAERLETAEAAIGRSLEVMREPLTLDDARMARQWLVEYRGDRKKAAVRAARSTPEGA